MSSSDEHLRWWRAGPGKTGARPLYFLAVGGVCAIVQGGLLVLLTEVGAVGNIGNLIAFAVSGQLNFLLNTALTWRDTVVSARRGRVLRVLRFNVVLAAAALANQVLYLGARAVLPYLLAAAAALIVTTVAKYHLSNRWVFRRRPGPALAPLLREPGGSYSPASGPRKP